MLGGWIELVVLTGVGFAMAGRRDIPNAAYWLGTQAGRLVGFIQGARARADQYTGNSELKALQNELRAGLRELDAVRSEMATTLARPIMSRQLGPMLPAASRIPSTTAATSAAMMGQRPLTAPLSSTLSVPPKVGIPPMDGIKSTMSATTPLSSPESFLGSQANTPTAERPPPPKNHAALWAPANHTIGAIAEEEWVRQGIEFKSRAELGIGLSKQQQTSSYDHSTSGSVVLSNLLQQSLVFDQYDRISKEQDDVLQSKVDSIKEKVEKSKAPARSSPEIKDS
ncbi:hypothetical protein ACA910_020744 [Epithemia clementina (nom. ined.)]